MYYPFLQSYKIDTVPCKFATCAQYSCSDLPKKYALLIKVTSLETCDKSAKYVCESLEKADKLGGKESVLKELKRLGEQFAKDTITTLF